MADNKNRIGGHSDKRRQYSLLHISRLRKALGQTFISPSPYYDIERVIDDFVFVCVLVGNDFLPSLPFLSMEDAGLTKVVDCYKEYVAALPKVVREGVDP